MPIPTYEEFMLPFLEVLREQGELRMRDVVDRLADRCHISDDERNQLLPSGQQRIISNRVGWARTYLKKAGLIESPLRGQVRLTQAGQEALNRSPSCHRALDNRPGMGALKPAGEVLSYHREVRYAWQVVASVFSG